MNVVLRRKSRLVASLLHALSLSILLLVSGCGPKIVTMVAPGEGTLEVDAIAVYPFQVQGRADPALSYQKTVDLVTAALEPHRFRVYSFGDFQIFTLDSLDAYEGRSLLAVARDEGIEASRMALLKGGVVFGTPGSHVSSASSQTGHRSDEKIDVRVWTELFHLGSRQTIARSETSFKLDPFDAGQFDPYPALTTQVRRLAKTTVSAGVKRIKAPAPYESLPFAYYADQSLFFKIASDDVPSIARKMLTMDEVDRSTELLRGYQYFYPQISMLEVTRLSLNPGLLVTGVSADWLRSAGLQTGDVVVKLNGARVESAHQLERQVLRSSGSESSRLVVVRAGREVELEVRRP